MFNIKRNLGHKESPYESPVWPDSQPRLMRMDLGYRDSSLPSLTPAYLSFLRIPLSIFTTKLSPIALIC